MRYFAALCIVVLALAGCDTQHRFDGEIVIVITCDLPPELCGASDAEFARFWDTLNEAERYDFVEEWGRPEPRSGFVAAHPQESNLLR